MCTHTCTGEKKTGRQTIFWNKASFAQSQRVFALTTELNTASLLTLTCGLWLVGSCAVCLCTAALMHRQWSRWIDAHTGQQLDRCTDTHSNKAVIDTTLIHEHRVITKSHVHTHTRTHTCTNVHTYKRGRQTIFWNKTSFVQTQRVCTDNRTEHSFLANIDLWTVTGGICAVCVCTAALFHVHRQWTCHPVGTMPSLATAQGMWMSTTCSLGNTVDPLASLWVSETQHSVSVRIKKV